VCGCSGQASDGKYYLTAFDDGGGSASCACGSCYQYGSWFTADKQRGWPCGTSLEICRQGTTKCVIARVVDFGPGCSVDTMAGGPVLDASPNICQYLFGTNSCGWSDRFGITVQLAPAGASTGPYTGGGSSPPAVPGSAPGVGPGAPPAATPCSYNGVSGSCATSCAGGILMSSSAGATGCQSLPTAWKCCTMPGQSSGGTSQQASPGGSMITGGPSCTYALHSGACISTTSCQAQSGQSFSSRKGANGCQAFASNIQCCIATASLLVGEMGDVFPPGAASTVSGGAIAGIVVGVVLFIALIGLLVFFVVRAKTPHAPKGEVVYANTAYDPNASTPVESGASATLSTHATTNDVPSVVSTGTYVCGKCGKSYSAAEDLTQHVAQRH